MILWDSARGENKQKSDIRAHAMVRATEAIMFRGSLALTSGLITTRKHVELVGKPVVHTHAQISRSTNQI